jgi:indolepyruvate ferredoxin oxidoreductase
VWTGPYDLLVTGVGGTGVVTVGAVIAMAAHLEGKSASVLDFMGFAQKGGSVLSFVRWADRPERLNQVRIDTQQADAILACDLVVGASPEALQTVRHGRTRVLANVHEVHVAEALHNPDANLRVGELLQKLQFAAGRDRVEAFDAQTLAQDFLGDTIVANILALGYAWQRGLVPVSVQALQRAIELNGVAVQSNQLAFALGRLAAADPTACDALRSGAAEVSLRSGAAEVSLRSGASETAPPRGDSASREQPGELETIDALIARGVEHLTGYQSAAYAQRYAERVRRVQAHEAALDSDIGLPFTRAVASSLLKLMAYKDEYEVARLYTDGAFQRELRAQFDGAPKLEFYMAPPLLSRAKNGQPPRKLRLGAWLLPVLRVLAKGRRLRGGALDPFGRTSERRMERELVRQYESRVDELLPRLRVENVALAAEIARVPLTMRGYGHVKIANVALARVREAELLHRLDPQHYPRPPSAPQAGQLRGIAVVAR